MSSKTNKRSVGGIGSGSRMNSSKVIVQKYGGTSVGGVDKLEKVFDIVSKFRNDSTRTFLHLFLQFFNTVSSTRIIQTN